MSLIVQKFGGSSIRDAAHLRNAAEVVAETYLNGNDVIAVLSAQGSTTDDFIEKANEVNPNASGREMDMLLSTGEQISAALCAMTLERMGLPCVSLAAWQVGIRASDLHGDARIEKISTERISAELGHHRIVLVTGFQGVNAHNDVTTLGRGGSDTSAVALAAAFHGDCCQIYTDVDGIYTADPRIVPEAKKLSEITCGEMLELAVRGAKVLHPRSVEVAQKYRVPLEVRSSLERKPGTVILETGKKSIAPRVSGIAGRAREFEKTGEVSVIGVRLSECRATSKIRFALQEAGISSQTLTDTETCYSVLVDEAQLEHTIRVLHRIFFT